MFLKNEKFLIVLLFFKIVILLSIIYSCSWNNPFLNDSLKSSSSDGINTTDLLSSNANLENLVVSDCSLDQAFSKDIINYTGSVSGVTLSVTVTPTSSDSSVSIDVRINDGIWNCVISGNASTALDLNLGDNSIDVRVTAEDSTEKVYTIVVARMSNDANLSNLVLSTGTLSPGFSSATTTYTASMPNSTASITVAPTSSDSNSTIVVRINSGTWNTVISGNPSGGLDLSLGYNSVEVRVTAEDSTVKTYTLSVRRDLVAVVTVPSISNFPMGDFTVGIAFPMHAVSSISSFKIGKYEVSYEQWHFIRVWALSNGYTFANAGKEGHDGTAGAAPTGAKNEPVMNVSWRDCIVWCNALSQYEGLTPVYYTNSAMTTPLKTSTNGAINTTAGAEDNPYVNWNASGYRLPTEAEWEASARYINGSSWIAPNYASGASGPSSDAGATGLVAWFTGNSGAKSQNIGTKQANNLGIYDMSGNANEWVWDWYGSYSNTDSAYIGSDARGPSSSAGNCRVLRSFYYNSPSTSVRATNRSDFLPYSTYYSGLRVVKK